MAKKRNRKAFTIVELVIVIAVIAVLATVLVPTFGDVINNAKDSAAKQEAKNAYTQYIVDHATEGEIAEYMIYDANDRFIALQNGAAVGVYDSKEDALKSMLANGDPAKLVANGKLLIYGTVVNSYNPYAGKVISILGDSISTLEGYIPVADGFNLKHRTRYVLSAKSDSSLIVMSPEETWWMSVINGLDAKLGINDSWAGSTVTNNISGNSGDLGEMAAMASLTRIQNLGSNGTPDVILFYGGTNDIGRSCTLGTFDSASAPTEVNLTATKWNTVTDAYIAAILRLKYYYPDAQIISMLPTYTTSYYNQSKLEQYNTVLASICEHYGVTCIDLRNCGITTSDLVDGIHPTAKGMEYIANAVLEELNDSNEVTPGENNVYSISHMLENATASKSYYKGVSAGKAFTESISGNDLEVTVTMGGQNITASCYQNGEINIPVVTGDIVITAKSSPSWAWATYLQTREGTNATTNLWTALTPINKYYSNNTGSYNASGWTTVNNVCSITVPVQYGELIFASSFGERANNGGTRNGIRVAFFLSDGSVLSYSPDEVYNMFKSSGYIVVPTDAVAACIPMWDNTGDWEIYIGGDIIKNKEMFKRIQHLPDEFTSTDNLLDSLDFSSNEYYTSSGWGNGGMPQVRSVTISISEKYQLKANSFGAKNTNNGSSDGIRLTWFLADGTISSISPADVYKEYKENGYLTAPDGVVSVNVVWWTESIDNYLYITVPTEYE